MQQKCVCTRETRLTPTQEVIFAFAVIELIILSLAFAGAKLTGWL